ncbi:MAG: hypothetical protein ACRDYW_04470 [Acidimicrobiales bacterium]
MPTFARELDDLGNGHLALWLADAMPSGPSLLWGFGRDLAVPLAGDRRRAVVLLTDDEQIAAATIRHGAPGLRVAHVRSESHVPDVSDLDLAGFASIVVNARADEPIDALLSTLLGMGAPGCSVCVLAPPASVGEVVRALHALGREVEVLDHEVAACSQITPPSAPDSRATLRQLGGGAGRVPDRHLVTAGIGVATPSVLVGEAQGLAPWKAGVEQMADTVTALDAHVDRATATRVEALEAELGDLRARLETAEGAARDAAQALEAVQRSTSWKVTAPLRSLTSLVRHP